MSTQKHTPGPWVRTNENGIRHADGKTLIAQTFWPSQEVNKANARLIAAAPELLEGLKQAVEELSDYAPTPLNGLSALIRKLDAVIDKAESQT